MNHMNIKNNLIIYLGFLAILLSGCASLPNQKYWPTPPEAASIGGFESEGRLAIKDYGKGSYANFSWQKEGNIQNIEINTPLGNSVGNLCQDSKGVIAQDSQGQIITANSIEELSQRLLGFTLPFEYLDQWIRGYRVANESFQKDTDGSIRQFGWKVRRQLQKDGETPRMVQLTNQRFDIKILFDEYNNTAVELNKYCSLRNQ